MASGVRILYQKLVLFVGIFWVSVSTYFPPLFDSFGSYLLFGFRKHEGSLTNNSIHLEISTEGSREEEVCFVEPNSELDRLIETEIKSEEDDVDFADGFSLQFKFPTYEEFCKSRNEKGDFSSFEAAQNETTMKYEFMAEKGFSGFVEESEVLKFNPKEPQNSEDYSPVGGKDGDIDSVLSDKDFVQIKSESIAINEIEGMEFTEEKEKDDDGEEEEFQLHYEKESSSINSYCDSINPSPLRSLMNRLTDSYSDGFLSDGDFGDERELLDEMSKSDEPDLGEEEDTYTMEELRKIEEAHLKNVGDLESDFLSEKDFRGDSENKKSTEDKGISQKVNSENKLDSDSEDSNSLESLWEHQELIEQLKMELKKVRATGLPTILEESESPKIAEDLKPWKIDEKLQKADRMGELHKFYKSYRERMRKLDILNYQKMYAIGFLQLKDPLQSISTEKSSALSVSTLLSHNIFPGKHKKVGNDPMMKFIIELQSDLEIVYVGQMCLSWEILHWQYGKALELWESDPHGIRLYNEVAGEFQQFQVLMQRFIEDEPFQGPRVQNYVKSRCVLRNLLQVPVIKEDSTKGKNKGFTRREMGDYAITSDMLVEILEESIRIFWRLVRADKDCCNVIVKSRKGLRIELQDPSDFELLMEVQTNLQKKEKKLKDLLRSGNCLLKKFRRCQEDDSVDQVLYFFSQVDMKLVGRVLNMPKITTDQLIWCRNKLRKISFVSKKIQVDPSFLLFPC